MDTLGDIKDFVIAPDGAEGFIDQYAVPAGIGYLALASNAPTDESAQTSLEAGPHWMSSTGIVLATVTAMVTIDLLVWQMAVKLSKTDRSNRWTWYRNF